MYAAVTSASSFSDDPTTPPIITVTIVVSGCETPTAGQNYTLTCSVSGASVTNYQWRKNSTMVSETGPTLSFYALRLSDAGQYTCEVTVNSMTLTDDVDVVIISKISKLVHCVYYSLSLLHPLVPPPTSVTITSDPVSPIRPVGSDVTPVSYTHLTLPTNREV